jgi:Carboxypeptidase regulatory-like domain/TonB dependent receptor-like, beta-barrel
MNHLRKFLCLAVAVASLTPQVLAQVQTAELHVIVSDVKGAVVRNASVTITDQARNLSRATTTNVDGQYVFLSVPPGVYTVTVEAPGFAKTVNRNLRLLIGHIEELPVSLSVAAANETVNVSAEAELVETQQTQSGATIDQTRIENLPINGRNYINFALTDSQLNRDDAPSIGAAPTSGLNIGGQRARNNLVNIDGANAVDNSVNGVRSTVSQDAVQEFQIITNGYAAEYGQAAAGVINIISKSGSNNFHGSLYGYLRNRNIQATNPFSNVANPAYTRVQAGATAGGAIKKDRTFYFFSFETTRRHETGFNDIGADNFGLTSQSDITRFVSAALGQPLPPGFVVVPVTPEQAQFLAVAPLNPQTIGYALAVGTSGPVAITGKNPFTALIPGLGPGYFAPTTSGFDALPASYVPLHSIIGNFPVHEATDIYSLRLDHRLTDNQNLMLRGSVSPSDVDGIEVNAQGPQNFGQNAWSRTSRQNFHDFSILAEHAWTIGSNKVNEFRFQYARRGLDYTYSNAPGGSNVAVNIPGFAFFGREPFSYVNRVEKRWETLDNFSIVKGTHNFKFGVDNSYIPLVADFTVNFGGLYDFGGISLGAGVPGLNPIQAYGAGIPQYLVQGVGNPHDSFSNDALGLFAQDSWRITRNVTVNYGLRYDVEFTPTFAATTPIAAAAEKALHITQGIPRSNHNFAPRIGVAWDVFGDGKTVVRSSYGIFYDHPLMALAFDSDVADGSQAPQLLLFGGGLTGCSPLNFNASMAFVGKQNCLPAQYTYLPNQQRFDPTPNTPSIWVNQNYLSTGIPLPALPFAYPTGANFKYGYSSQASLAIEHDFGHNLALALQYNFNGGRHLYRPINLNAAHGNLIVQNWLRAYASGDPGALSGNPLEVGSTGAPCGLTPAGLPWVAPSIVNFFRPSGLNPTYSAALGPGGPISGCAPLVNAVLSADGLGVGVPVPFSDEVANLSNGTSSYNAFTVNLRKRFSSHYEFLASYTWSHAFDDSTDLQATVAPQNNFNPNADRSTSLFDQRHRFVFSGVYQSGNQGGGWKGGLLSNWTVAPILEVGSGRPFNIVTGFDQNFDFGATTDRPMVATSQQIQMAKAGIPDACGQLAVASKYSPSGYLIPTCFANALVTGVIPPLEGNLGRNVGTKPLTFFNDLRIARSVVLHENVRLQGIMDLFNLVNKFNVADVNPIWNQAGVPTAAYEPRQFQFALRLTW